MVAKVLFYFSLLTLTASLALAQGQGSISGHVTFQGNVALHNTSVQVVQLKRFAVTDETGKYEISDIPPGIYTVLFRLEGFTDLTRIVDVKRGESNQLDVQLQISAVRGEVTIMADGSEQSVFDSFKSVTSVNSNRLIQKASVGLGATLEDEAGVARRGFGVGSSRPVIRGFDNDRVLVTKDGIRTGSLGSQSGDHGETIDVLNVERIEVVQGPSTLLYGGNAVGGIVNAVIDDATTAEGGLRGNFTTLGNTNNRQAAAAGGLVYGFKKWEFMGNGSFQREGDYTTPLGRIPNSSTRSGSGTFGADYFSNKYFIKNSFSLDSRRFGTPYVALFEDGEVPVLNGHELPETPDEATDIDSRNFSYTLKGGFRNFGSFVESGDFSINYNRYQQREIGTVDNVDTLNTTFRNNTFSYRASFDQKPGHRLTGTFGFEGFSRDFSVVGEEILIEGAKVDQNSFSVFTLQNLAFKRISFQFGGRVENNRFNPLSTNLDDRNITGVSAGLAAKIGLWKGGNLVIGYTNSFRSPSLDELYNNGPHTGTVSFEVGDDQLKGERTNGLDISLRHLSDRFRLEANVYYYKIKNFVYLTPVDENGDGEFDIEDNLYVKEYRQSDASFIGTDVNLTAKVNSYVSAFFGSDLIHGKLTRLNENAWRMPPTRGKIGLDFNYKGLNVRPELIFARTQSRVFLLETPTAGYGIFGLSASYTIANDHMAQSFGFDSFNLGDKLYRNHLSYIKDLAPEAGRGFRFSYSVRFF